jgi:AbrB family looped-hinge helix DNA binding protein
MAKKKEDCCEAACSCRVEALVSVDERGQMVLPKELRERAGLRPGDKLAVVIWEQGGEVCCMSLVKAGQLTGMVRQVLGPMMEEILNPTTGGKKP